MSEKLCKLCWKEIKEGDELVFQDNNSVHKKCAKPDNKSGKYKSSKNTHIKETTPRCILCGEDYCDNDELTFKDDNVVHKQCSIRYDKMIHNSSVNGRQGFFLKDYNKIVPNDHVSRFLKMTKGIIPSTVICDWLDNSDYHDIKTILNEIFETGDDVVMKYNINDYNMKFFFIDDIYKSELIVFKHIFGSLNIGDILTRADVEDRQMNFSLNLLNVYSENRIAVFRNKEYFKLEFSLKLTNGD